MTVTLHTPFTTNTLGPISASVYHSPSSTRQEIQATGDMFCAVSYSAGTSGFTIEGTTYKSAIGELQDALNGVTLFGYAKFYQVIYNPGINRIVVSSSAAEYTDLYFSKPTCLYFGFEFGRNYGTSGSFQGTYGPWFTFQAHEAERNNYSDMNDERTEYQERIANSGKVYGIKTITSPHRETWTFINEPKRKVFKYVGQPVRVFSYEELLEHAGMVEPLLLFTGSANNPTYPNREATYKLTAQGTRFQQQRLSPDYDAFFNVTFQGRLIDGGKSATSGSSAIDFV